MSELVLVQFQHFQSAQSEQHAHWQLSDSVVVQAQSFQEVHLFNLGRDVHQPRVITEVDDLQILMGEELAINLLELFVSQIERCALHKLPEQCLPLVIALSGARSICLDVLLVLLSLNVTFIESHFEVFFELHSIGTSHCGLDRSQRVAFN